MQGRLFAGIAALVTFAIATPAEASWSEEQRLFKPQSTGWLSLGVATDGSAIALWATAPPEAKRYSIRYAIRTAGTSTFGSPLTLQGNLSRSFSFGMAESGTAFVQLIERDGRLTIVRLDPQAGVVSRSTMARSASSAELDVAYDGTAVAVYKTRGRIYSRTAIAGGRFGAPKRLDPPRGDAFPEEVAAGPGGRGLVAWSGRRDEVFAAQQLAGEGFGRAKPIPKALFPSGGLDLAASARESFVLINAPDQHPEPLVAVASAGKQFEPARALDTSGAARGSSGLIDVDAVGNATVAWKRSRPRSGAPRGVDSATRPPGGSFTKGKAVFNGRGGFDSLDVASDGGAVLSFNENVPNQSGDFDQRLRAAVRPPGGDFLPSERVGSILSVNGLIESVVATAAGAQPTAIWSEPGAFDELGVLSSFFADAAVKKTR